MPAPTRHVIAAVLVSSILAPVISAQCSLGVGPAGSGIGLPGIGGSSPQVLAIAPLSEGVVAVAGSFAQAGNQPVANIATYHPSGNWKGLGAGLSGPVAAIVVMPDEALVAGGVFGASGTVPLTNVARWSGGAWQPLSHTYTMSVDALAVGPAGDLFAFGRRWLPSFAFDGEVARWTGSAWQSLGSLGTGRVEAMIALPNGDLVIGGVFTSVGGVPAHNVARWNGSAWHSMSSSTSGSVQDLTVIADGRTVAVGNFLAIGGVFAARVAAWNGTTWQPFGNGFDTSACAVLALPGGDFLVGGSSGTTFSSGFRRWRATANVWESMPALTGTVWTLARIDNAVFVGGSFMQLGGAANGIRTLATNCPASATAFGVGCPGSGGANILAPMVLPFLGDAYLGRGTELPANAFVASLIGFQALSVPLALVLPQAQAGCLLRVQASSYDLFVTHTGSAEVSLAIPSSAAVLGQTFLNQLVPIEVDALGNIMNATVTNALSLVIGAL